MKTFTREEAVAFIRKRQGVQSLTAYAKALGISRELLQKIYKGTYNPGPKIGFEELKKLRLYKRTTPRDRNATAAEPVRDEA